MRTTIAALAVALAGCGQGQVETIPAAPAGNHGYGYAYDGIGRSGLRIRYASTTDRSLFTLDLVERDFLHVSECMAINAPGPLVVFVDQPINGWDGYAFFDTGLIVIYRYPVFGHELVHYLLAASRYNGYANANHQHSGFQTCGGDYWRG